MKPGPCPVVGSITIKDGHAWVCVKENTWTVVPRSREIEPAMSHSPGPWKTGPINYADVYGSDGELVALIIKDNPSTVADAQLIAAAPELLAALKLVWQMFEDGRIVRNIANDGNPDWALRMLTFTQELQTVQLALMKAETYA
jgi:hypothetical protein